MPYISKSNNRREELVETLEPINRGELNFLLYYHALEFVERMGINYHTLDDAASAYERLLMTLYHEDGIWTIKKRMRHFDRMKKGGYLSDNLNVDNLLDTMCFIVYKYIVGTGDSDTVAGTVRLSQAEFIRKIVSPYEDQKIEENGDVSLFTK